MSDIVLSIVVALLVSIVTSFVVRWGLSIRSTRDELVATLEESARINDQTIKTQQTMIDARDRTTTELKTRIAALEAYCARLEEAGDYAVNHVTKMPPWCQSVPEKWTEARKAKP